MAYKELATKKPFIVNKNLGSALEVEPEELTLANADGLPVVNPTQKQKYDFDRKGWLVIPNVLSDEDIAEMNEFCQRLSYKDNNIPEPQRCGLGGPLQKLADHPIVVGFLNEFLSYPPASSEDCYGFRLEESQTVIGGVLKEDDSVNKKHYGNGLFRLPGDSHIYRCVPGRGWSGLTKAIWELSAVDTDSNDLRFITASHKSAYSVPQSSHKNVSALWETYECPPGSLILLTESITQKTILLSEDKKDNERVRISNLYNTVGSRWSNWLPPTQLLEAMPPKRQTLFRETYAGRNVVNGDFAGITSAFPREI